MTHPSDHTPETQPGTIYIGNGEPAHELALPVTYQNGHAVISFRALRNHLNSFSDPDGVHSADELSVYVPVPGSAVDLRDPTHLSFYGGKVAMNADEHCVYYYGEPVELPPLQYRILECLGRNAGIVMSRSQITEETWGLDGYDKSPDAVRIQVMRIRARLDPGVIETVKHFGYRAAK